MTDGTRIFALATRGIEAIAAEEISRIPGSTVDACTYRRVAAHCPDLRPLLDLRCADDVFVEAGVWDGVGRPRSTLPHIAALAGKLDLRPGMQACRSLRTFPTAPSFSVTPSFVGKRNYSTDEIRTTIATAVAGRHGWTYRERDEDADLNLRVFIEHERAFVGLRLAVRPLHERSYKQMHSPGSLKPPVAAAMLALARIRPGLRVLDPCCGAGTILAEAHAYGAIACGGDIAPAALAAAQANTCAAGACRPVRWDARSLPLADRSVDRVVSNLPWGLQVASEADLDELYVRACAEIQRVLVPGGRAVILAHAPEILRFPLLRRERDIEISLSGLTPVIAVLTLPG